MLSCQEKQSKTYRIVFLQCCHDEWRDVMNSEMKRELAFHPEINLEILESFSNTQKQVEQIKELENLNKSNKNLTVKYLKKYWLTGAAAAVFFAFFLILDFEPFPGLCQVIRLDH